WDTAKRTAPVFVDAQQLAVLTDLLSRHAKAISRRLAAGYRHLPLLEDRRPGQDGCAWCYGFMVGVALRPNAWQPLLDSAKMGPLFAVITALAEADELSAMEAASPEERAEVIEALSGIPLAFADFWRRR